MVRIVDESNDEAEQLEQLIRSHASKHGLKLEITGWARKTFDLFADEPKARKARAVARLESFATTSGEIKVFDDIAMPFATALAAALEAAFPRVREATLVRERAPN